MELTAKRLKSVLFVVLLVAMFSFSVSSRNTKALEYYFYFGVPGLIILFLVLDAIGIKCKKSKTYQEIDKITFQEKYLDYTRDMAEFEKIDPNFSSDNFRKQISKLYVDFREAWRNKNLEIVRPYFSEIAYERLNMLLDHYRRKKETNVVKRVKVLEVILKGWKQEHGKDIIIAQLKVKENNYVIKDKSGRVVRRSTTAVRTMTYDFCLERTTGVTTATEDGTTEQRCPNCGGKININKTAECPYCRFVVTTDKFGWLVSTIISQKIEE